MIEIKISDATPLGALASVTALGIRCMANEEVSAAANRILEAESSGETKETDRPPLATVLPGSPAERGGGGTGSKAPTHEAGHPPAEESPFPEPRNEADRRYTLAEVRAAGVAAAQKHGREAVKAILTALHAESMTALAEADYPAFMGKLEGLGGGNA